MITQYIRRFFAEGPPPARDECCEPQHLEVISVARLTSDHPLAYHQTLVLKRCRICSHHHVLVYTGDWSLQDFVKKENDIDALNRMVGK